MISDNIPKTWDLALRYCKCRKLWVERIYDLHIRPYNSDWRPLKERKRLKSIACKQYTGKTKDDFGNYCTFKDTTEIERILSKDKNKDLYEFWTTVNTWVMWFQKNLIYIENALNGAEGDIIAKAMYLDERFKIRNEKLTLFIVKQLC